MRGTSLFAPLGAEKQNPRRRAAAPKGTPRDRLRGWACRTRTRKRWGLQRLFASELWGRKAAKFRISGFSRGAPFVGTLLEMGYGLLPANIRSQCRDHPDSYDQVCPNSRPRRRLKERLSHARKAFDHWC